jgi:hypothetical protein
MIPDHRSDRERMLTGMFRERESTERAYDTVHERGYTKDEINVIMSDDTRKRYFTEDFQETEICTKAAEDSVRGAAIGGTVGAFAGVIAALGSNLVVPGLGLVVAGPIAAGLAGAGGITGGLIGALVGSGIPEARAKVYESGIKNGKIVLAAKPRDEDDAKYFEEKWRASQGEEIYVGSE